MTIASQITAVVDWLAELNVMSDTDYVNNDYWNLEVLAATSGSRIGEFCTEINIVDPDRYTAIAVLQNFRLNQLIVAFTNEV